MKKATYPIGPNEVKYLDVIIPQGLKPEQSQQINALNIQDLTRLFKTVADRAIHERKLIQESASRKIEKIPFLPNHIIYLRHKYLIMYSKLHKYIFEKLRGYIRSIRAIIEFIQESEKLNTTCTFNYESFEKDMDLKNDPNIKSMQWRIEALKEYIGIHIKDTTIPKVTAEELYTLLTQTLNEVVVNNEYVPPNNFDEMFYIYAMQTGLIKKFDQLVRQMPQYGNEDMNVHIQAVEKGPIEIPEEIEFSENEKTLSHSASDNFDKLDLSLLGSPQKKTNSLSLAPEIENQAVTKYDFKDFNNFVQFFCMLLCQFGTIDEQRFLIMRCASIRILFDRYYAKNSSILIGEGITDPTLIEQFNHQRNLKIGDLSKYMTAFKFPDTLSEIPFIGAIGANLSYIEALSDVLKCQFMVNPLDISYLMFKALKNLEKVALELYQTIKRDFKPVKGFFIAFDDLFSLMLPVFATQPFASPTAFKHFLEIFADLHLSTSLDHARITTTAIVDYYYELAKKKKI